MWNWFRALVARTGGIITRRVLLPALPALLLATACTSTTIPGESPVGIPELTISKSGSPSDNGDPISGTLKTADGTLLPLRAWLPPDPALQMRPKAVILAIHGFNDYSNAFDMPARWWGKKGYATYSYDQRGFGAAPNRGYWAGCETLDADMADAARLVTARYPGVPIYYVGESMGAAVIMTALGRGVAPQPTGTILVAPAVWSRSYMPFYQRVALWVVDNTLPGLRVTGRGLHIVPSDNIAMLEAYSRDPLVIKRTRVDAIRGLVDLMDRGMQASGEISSPTLVLIGAHDQVVPKKPQWAAVANLPDPAHQRAAYYKSGYHMLLRDLEGKTVWGDIAAWMENPGSGLPSAADAAAQSENVAMAPQ